MRGKKNDALGNFETLGMLAFLIPVFRNPAKDYPQPGDTAKTVQKPAQAEQFAFDVEATGLIDVINENHENPEEHLYVVSIDDVTNELMACTCPHHVHRNAFCKHMAAIENAIDDGTLNVFTSEDEDDAEPEDCDCEGLNGFPCWPCVRTGRTELPI